MEYDKDELHEDTLEEKYCEEHDLIKIQNAVGQFVCPFCKGDLA